jgi:hypothetical protein
VFKRDCTIAHDRDPIGERDRLVDVVCHEKDARPMVGDEFADKVMHADSRQRIACSERFVQQQKLGLLHQRAGKRHALGLPARKIGRALRGSGLVGGLHLIKLGRGYGLFDIAQGCSIPVAPRRVSTEDAMRMRDAAQETDMSHRSLRCCQQQPSTHT